MELGAVRAQTAISLMVVAATGAGCMPPEPRQPPPACVLEITPLNESGGSELALAFLVGNPGRAVEQGSYFEPAIHFALTARAGGRDLPIIKPEVPAMAEAQVPAQKHARAFELPPGGGIRIPTPIRLRVDSAGTHSADWFVWTIQDESKGPISLEAKLDLGAAAPRACLAEYTPK